MHLFDLHADTPLKLYLDGLSFSDSTLGVSAHDLAAFEQVTQVFACFCQPRLTDEEAYRTFFAMRDRLLSEILPYRSPHFTPLLAVEDARLLCGDLQRLHALAKADVRILTLVWKGASIIGGAYDTSIGLTPFGKQALLEAVSLGICPDVSHASIPTLFDVAEASATHGFPFLATHSNSYAICPHPRNLTDEGFLAIRDSGGLVGLCLYPPHLTDKEEATVSDVLKHLEHWLSLNGADTVALGTDFDGIDKAPLDLHHHRDLLLLREELARLGYSDTLIEKLFSKNAEVFFGKYIK